MTGFEGRYCTEQKIIKSVRIEYDFNKGTIGIKKPESLDYFTTSNYSSHPVEKTKSVTYTKGSTNSWNFSGTVSIEKSVEA